MFLFAAPLQFSNTTLSRLRYDFFRARVNGFCGFPRWHTDLWFIHEVDPQSPAFLLKSLKMDEIGIVEESVRETFNDY